MKRKANYLGHSGRRIRLLIDAVVRKIEGTRRLERIRM